MIHLVLHLRQYRQDRFFLWLSPIVADIGVRGQAAQRWL